MGGSLIGAVGDCKIPLLSAYENDVLPYTTFEFKLKAGLMVVESRLGWSILEEKLRAMGNSLPSNSLKYAEYDV